MRIFGNCFSSPEWISVFAYDILNTAKSNSKCNKVKTEKIIVIFFITYNKNTIFIKNNPNC